MRIVPIATLVAVAFAVISACIGFSELAVGAPQLISSFPAKGSPTTALSRTMVFAGGEHHYLIQPVHKAGRHPVVILLHGGESDDDIVWRQTSLPTLGARDGFIVVAPNALKNRHWNDGRGRVGHGEPSDADDVGYLRALIAHVVAHEDGDPNAVFMTGLSNGGLMTIRFVCEGGDLLRAAGNAISNLPIKQAVNCHVGKPLPWISINGDRDPNMHFAGMPAGTLVNGRPQAGLESADQTFTFFANNARCSAAVRIVALPNINVGDGSTAEKRVRDDCAGGTTSTQYVLHNAGHALPGEPRIPARMREYGNVNEDLDAGSLIWAHFKQTLGRNYRPASDP
jgi:polyhydroxybutyrate depolymerase